MKLHAALILALICLAAPAIGATRPNIQGMSASACATGSALVGGGAGNSPACAPTPSTAGTVYYWNGTAWVLLAGNASGTQYLSETSAGVPSWATVSGSGTVTSIIAGTGLSGGTITSAGTIALALTNATLQAQPSIPGTAITSTTGAMAGLGTTCHLTPVYSGRVQLWFNGAVFNTTALDVVQTLAAYGTGTAPSFNGSLAGTTVGTVSQATSPSASAVDPFSIGGVITGLTPGTAYWFDIQALVNAGSMKFSSISCTAMEF